MDSEAFERMKAAGLSRVEALRRDNIDAEGFVKIPFRCQCCDEKKANVALVSGDGLPVCGDCIRMGIDALNGVERDDQPTSGP